MDRDFFDLADSLLKANGENYIGDDLVDRICDVFIYLANEYHGEQVAELIGNLGCAELDNLLTIENLPRFKEKAIDGLVAFSQVILDEIVEQQYEEMDVDNDPNNNPNNPRGFGGEQPRNNELF